MVLVAYVAILFVGPAPDTKGGLQFQVAAQKVIVYASIVNLALQARGHPDTDSLWARFGRFPCVRSGLCSFDYLLIGRVVLRYT
jgi:hypothetical protein